MDPYALIAQIPNAGEAFSNAFNQGMQGNAINSLMQNPNDPQALAAYAKYDPKSALEYSLQQNKQSATTEQTRTTDWHKYAGELAKWADTPEKWDQAIDHLLQSNHPDISTPELMQLKGHFDPALRQSFMALGGVQDDKPQPTPAVMQEYQAAQAQGYKGGIVEFEQLLHPPGAVTVPYGATVGAPAQTPTQPLRLNPQTGQWEPEGGAGGNASGGFPQR